ncbi:iron-containing alcohol dehydrogenase [Kocuria rosea]|uniref:Iron-containing alcohol dehydrogenase n=1 Tax=Kocuria rosea TaxID=1275 RepID=A0A4R5Y6H7_KOCRO|nr:iron-containing alcohol dehydrogenase [Kocuria rosea]TDL40153.1 iron-containing alcohol dehydrogenase [Kocuria rosea]
MSDQTYIAEPVQSLLREIDPQNELPPCGLQRLLLGSNAVSAVASTVQDLLAGDGRAGRDRPRVALLVDRTPILRQGEDLKDLVENQLREHFDVQRTVLDDGQQELHVVEPVLEDAARAASGADAVVAVGGGTISDIGKVAAQRAGRSGIHPVLVSVQTAASVDGYTDDVSVVVREGVKRTVPTCWPDGVVADAETIAQAPARMNRAGFGEMTSMLVAPADWRLASLVGTDEGYRPGPVRLLQVVGEDIDSWSAGIRDGEPRAVAALTRALALRGVVTGVAGSTAVLSGMEHLISHMLDQYHGQKHLPMGLHGAQVGVATVIAAAAWEMLLERLAKGGARIDDAALDLDGARSRVYAAFSTVDPTDRIADECWRDYSAKLGTVVRLRPRLEGLLESWGEHEGELRRLLRPSAEIAAGLRASGAAAVFGELDPRIGPDLAWWAVANCALMRNRFTVADMLTVLGWWTPEDVDEVLARAGRAVLAGNGGRSSR